MSVRHVAMMVVLGLLMLAPPIVSAKRLEAARGKSATAEALLLAAQRDAQEILELRNSQETVAARKRPQEHVLAQVNSVLAEAGIPSRKLQGVRPEADQALAVGPSSSTAAQQYRRQSVSISFQQMSVSELGQFLVSWQEASLIWRPSRIELSKSRGRDDEHYDITLVISAVYIAEARRVAA